MTDPSFDTASLSIACGIRAAGSNPRDVADFQAELANFTFERQDKAKKIYLAFVAEGASDEEAVEKLNAVTSPADELEEAL